MSRAVAQRLHFAIQALNGNRLALASVPGHEGAHFCRVSGSKHWEEINDDPALPNFSVQSDGSLRQLGSNLVGQSGLGCLGDFEPGRVRTLAISPTAGSSRQRTLFESCDRRETWRDRPSRLPRSQREVCLECLQASFDFVLRPTTTCGRLPSRLRTERKLRRS